LCNNVKNMWEIIGNYIEKVTNVGGWCFLFRWLFLISLTIWILKTERKGIIFSFKKEKQKLCYWTLAFTSLLGLFHFAIKTIFFYSQRSIKIEKQIETIVAIKQNAPWQLLGIIFISCILAPLVEEYIFRYLIFKFLSFNFFSCLVSFFCFIFWHYQLDEKLGLLFCQYFSATLFFILTYWLTKKLVYPIFLHSLVNIIFIILVLMKPDFPLI